MPPIQQILEVWGTIGVLLAPLLVFYYLYRLNRADNHWRFADMLMTRNRESMDVADLNKFSQMVALITWAVVVIYMSVDHCGGEAFVTIFIAGVGIFSGAQVAGGALRVWDNKRSGPDVPSS